MTSTPLEWLYLLLEIMTRFRITICQMEMWIQENCLSTCKTSEINMALTPYYATVSKIWLTQMMLRELQALVEHFKLSKTLSNPPLLINHKILLFSLPLMNQIILFRVNTNPKANQWLRKFLFNKPLLKKITILTWRTTLMISQLLTIPPIPNQYLIKIAILTQNLSRPIMFINNQQQPLLVINPTKIQLAIQVTK